MVSPNTHTESIIILIYRKGKQNSDGLAPAANHVQQRWNVYNQAYMKAATGSIATRASAAQGFRASAALMR